MQITVKGKQLDVGDSLRQHVETKLNDAVAKYFQRSIEAVVTLSREAHLVRADVTVHAGRGVMVQGSAADADPYIAADKAIEHAEKRLRRHKRRLKDHHQHVPAEQTGVESPYYVLQPQDDEAHAESPAPAEKPHGMIIAEMTTRIDTLSVSDAVMRLDLGDLPALMFRNAANGVLNLVYRRADGNIGWVDSQNNGSVAA